jgi:oligoribonuclease
MPEITPEYLVPTDVETTGLSPDAGHLLLEVAVFIADADAPFDPIEPDGFHAIIQHDRDVAYAAADDYVRNMHEQTGLWDKLEGGTPQDEVDEQLLAYLQKHIGKREGRVFGNSVRLDMNFLDAHLPKSAAYLHYRFLDASGLAWFVHRNFGVPYFEKKKTHAAIDDINESIGELRHITRHLKGEA